MCFRRDAAEGCVDVHGQCYLQRSCWCPWPMLQPETMLLCVVYVTTTGHVDVCEVCCCQRPWLCVQFVETVIKSMIFDVADDHMDVHGLYCMTGDL